MLIERLLRIISLLTVLWTVSSLPSTAADTLVIASQQTINVCNSKSDQKFLIYVYLGEIYFSDSLMSFDIFLKYDTTKLVFTDMFTTGTLAAQMSDLGPVWRPKDQGGVCYAGGASILRHARGKQPLIAFQGQFKGGCGESTIVSLDEILFNSEFRRQYSNSVSGIVRTIAKGTVTDDIAAVFQQRRFIVNGRDSTASLPLTLKTPGISNGLVECTVQMVHAGAFTIDSVQPSVPDSTFNMISASQTLDTSTFIWTVKAQNTAMDYRVNVRSLTSDNSKLAIVSATIRIVDSCYCRIAKNTDTMRTCVIENRTMSTSVFQTVVDEGTAWCTTVGGDIIIQSLHGQPESVEVFTLLGERVPVVLRGDQQTMVITGDHLPNAPVLVQMQSGGVVRLKMVMK